MPRVGQPRYPRECRGKAGPHLIESPTDEYPTSTGQTCRRCAISRFIGYQKTPKGRRAKARADRRYDQSPSGREVHLEAKRQYKKTPKGLESEARYLASEVGRQMNVKKSHRYRARKRLVPSEPYSVADVYVKTGGLCYYNPSHVATTIDHVVPISRGGPDAFDNVVPACKSCNSRKADKTPEEWQVTINA